MPIRIENPFKDPTANLKTDVNPFLEKMRLGLETGEIPVLYGPKLKPLKGRWKEEFSQSMSEEPKKIILEIGSHKGEVLKKMAADNCEYGFVGLDITFKRVVTLAEKAKALDLRNLRSLLCNGKALAEVFAESELDGVIVFFPDPWAKKKRQQKNRLLNREFLLSLSQVLKPGGFFWFKTDHKPYFDDVVEAAEKIFKLDKKPSGLPALTYTSRFERHFQEQGEPTYEICWIRP